MPDKDETKKPVVPPKPNPDADNKQEQERKPPAEPQQTRNVKPNTAVENTVILTRKSK